MAAPKNKPPFFFRDVFYRSLAEACEKLSVEPTYVYNLKRRKKLSDADALEYCLQYRENHPTIKGQEKKGRKRAVEINGRQYESYGEALAAYGIPRISVTSCMQRENRDFQAAMMKMIMKKYDLHLHDLKFEHSSIVSLSDPEKGLSNPQKKFYHDIKPYFEEAEIITSNQNPGFKLQYRTPQKVITCYAYFSGKTLGVIVPELMTGQAPSMDLFNKINAYNQISGACSIGYHSGCVSASTVFDFATYYHRLFPKALFAFLDKCSGFLSGQTLLEDCLYPQSLIPLQSPQEELTEDQFKSYVALKSEVQTVQCYHFGEQVYFSYPLLLADNEPVDCYSAYGIHSHKMIVPDLIQTVASRELLEMILQFNYYFAGCKLWHDGERLSASWETEGESKGFFKKSCHFPLRRFLNSCWFFSQRLYAPTKQKEA